MLGTGAGSLELEGRETKQLGSPREGGIDKAIGKGPQVLSLWEATPVECEGKSRKRLHGHLIFNDTFLVKGLLI